MIRELSLFTGYSGISLGVKLAGINTRTVAYVEWEKYPQDIIKARIRDGFLDDAPLFGDISTFRGEQFRGLVDLITGGFPCQPHSLAGARRSSEDSRNKWPDTLRVIREVAPRYVLLENVAGLLSSSVDERTPAYGGVVVGQLAEIGYDCFWEVVGADDAGAPHRRKRWFCFGVANTQHRGMGETETSGADNTRGIITTGSSSTFRGTMADPEKFPGNEWSHISGQGQGELGRQSILNDGNLADSASVGHRGGLGSERGDGERVIQQDESGRSEVGSEAARRDRDLGNSNDTGNTTHQPGTNREWQAETQKQQQITWAEPTRQDSQLADSEGRQSGEPTTRNWGEGAERGSTELADPDSSDTGRQDWYDSHGSWSRGQASKPRLDQRGTELADPGIEGLQGGIGNHSREERQTSTPVEHDWARVRSQVGRGDGAMADTDSIESTSHARDDGKERSFSQAQRQSEHSSTVSEREGGAMADSASTREWQEANGLRPEEQEAYNQGWSRLRHGANPNNGAMADSDSGRSGKDIQPSELWSTGTEQSSGDSGSSREGEDGEVQTERGAIYPTSELADSISEGLEGVKSGSSNTQGWQGPDGSPGLRSGAIPTWPPGPNESDEWGRILAERPDLSPAITKEAEREFCLLVDGRSYRVDQLKALGNGVVPAVVAQFLRRLL